MCKEDDEYTRPRTAELLIWVGVAAIVAAVGLLAGLYGRAEMDHLLAEVAIAGVIIGAMFVKTAAIIARIDRIEIVCRHCDQQVSGQLVEDPDKVTRLQRRY